MHGGDVDDGAAASAHVRNGILRAEEDAAQVDGDLAIPLLGRQFGNRAVDLDAGVVDEHIEAAEF